MDNPEFTILVAVYNAERYLKNCMDSLLSQTILNIQVICIDDASTDRSLSILNEYSEKDSRIKIIALKENKGQAFARNQGLKIAKGKYIAFLDSDDWMSSDCLEQAKKTFDDYPNTDSVLLHTIYYYSKADQREYKMQPFDVLSGYDAFVKSLTWEIHGVYIVKNSIHQQYPYDDSSHSFSDDNTTRLHYLASREVRSCSGIYYYRQNQNSVSHLFSIYLFDYLSANMSMKKILLEHNISEELIDLYENHRWLNVIGIYMQYFRHRKTLKKENRREALSKIHNAWKSIEVNRLSIKNKLKFGYIPIHWSWHLFRLQEEVYFTLRRLLGK